jgi:hypothetical protein
MQAHLPILKRVGKILIVIGLVDIGVMIYHIANSISYSSHFNIFAVIAGIFLVRGSLRATAIVTWFSAFLIALFAGSPLVMLFIQPFDLSSLQLRLYPGTVALSATFWVFTIVLFYWVLKELRCEAVLVARGQSGEKVRSLRAPLALGALIPVVLTIGLLIILNSETAHLAQAKARKQFGPGYQYFVSSLEVNYSSQGKFVAATVTVYNNHKIHIVPVRWSEKETANSSIN